MMMSSCGYAGWLITVFTIFNVASLALGYSRDDDLVIKRMFNRAQSNRVKRLIGSEEIVNGQYPWLVSLRAHIPIQMVSYFAVKYKDFYCAGSIIDKRWIVTAAHCFSEPDVSQKSLLTVNNWFVKAGDVRLSFTVNQKLCAIVNRIRKQENFRCWYLNVEKIVIHPEFIQKANWINDIALIKLSTDLPFAPLVSTIDAVALPASNTLWPLPGRQCIIQSWGCSRAGGALTPVARSVTLPVADNNQCSQIIPSQIESNQLCAGFNNNNKGLCRGDSGGGLVCIDDNTGYWTLAGIASFTSRSFGDSPGVFTRVSAYVDWIRNVTSGSN